MTEPDKTLLIGFGMDRGRALKPRAPLADLAGTHAKLSLTELAIHWPIPDSDNADMRQRVVSSGHVQEASQRVRCRSAGKGGGLGSQSD
ncbi:hypothetical protein [Streptomyces atratus]|uniref:hypothetical protein n=1 Tax=Streptomyces atratus TaxID=1893 RepID=UPI003252EF40